MQTIDATQVKRIYALAGSMGMTERSSHDDALHQLVDGITGKQSVKALSYQEAVQVLAELSRRKQTAPPRPRTRPKQIKQVPGGATAQQQRKVWALMYQLREMDTTTVTASIGERLCGIIRKELQIDAMQTNPFAWITFGACDQLIESLKGYVKTTARRTAKQSAAKA